MAHRSSLLFVAAMLLGCSGAQQHHAGEPDRAQAHADASVARGSAPIAAALRGSHRSLLMREVHMMKNWGTLDTWLREIHRALKPNRILGVEDHRAAPGANPEETVEKGYLPEAWVIEKIEAAGFALAGTSEINANPRDTKDYPNGVWSLPPSFEAGPDYTPADARDRARYAPIGESDRMTLKFVRVADGAAR